MPFILRPEEQPVLELVNINGDADLVLVCEHAANTVPTSLAALGLSEAALASHIAWDLGAREIALELSEHFNAPLVAPRYSRLVYDCNRAPEALDAISERSEAREVAGNRNLDAAARSARFEEFYVPIRDAIASILDARAARGRRPALVTVHSFTPTFLGTARAVQLGILHDDDTRLADALLSRAAAVTGLKAERNAPYGPADGTTHTLRTHAVPRGLPNVMLEIRNDLIADVPARHRVAATLIQLLEQGLAAVQKATPYPPVTTTALRG